MLRLLQRAARKALRPFYPLYYRFLYGRLGSAGERLEAWVHRWETASRRRDVPAAAEAWDQQYAAGEWSLLHRPQEVARYAVLVGFLHHLAPDGSVLDVGCGEGILRDLLRPYGYRAFTGIDVAAAAVEKAARGADARARFLTADAETWEPDGRYEAVVFNECLYYFRRPLRTLERYAGALEPGGVMVVSMFTTPRSNAILRRLLRRHAPLVRTRLVGDGGAWNVVVLRPGGTTP